MQLIIGIEGLSLCAQDAKRLEHNQVAGVILFTRNYESPEQLKALTAAIRKKRSDLFISVDHEGGSVQRFRKGFTLLPKARQLLDQFRLNPNQALLLAEQCGFITSIELQQHGIDFSYAPVLDLDFGLSTVIGDRSFGSLAQEVVALAGAVMRGMHRAGSHAVGKHFPGHGGVRADTHHDVAIDPRAFQYLCQADLVPFQQLIQQGLDAIMPAHVIYSDVDTLPAGFSKIWLQDILRGQMQFKGLIISDDLDMAAARTGTLADTLALATQAGCDLALLCNNFSSIDEAITLSKNSHTPISSSLSGKYINHIPTDLLTLLHQAQMNLSTIYS